MKTELVKPTKKGKRDGEVNWLSSDEATFLVMRGDYPRETIIQKAIECCEIDAEDAADWEQAEYFQSWYKTLPSGGNDGYSSWNYPLKSPCRGAYFASALVRG